MDTSFQSSGPQDLGRCRFPADVGCFVKMLIWPMSSFQLLDFLPSFPQDGAAKAKAGVSVSAFFGHFDFPVKYDDQFSEGQRSIINSICF